MPALTSQQSTFVTELVRSGCTRTEAAKRAGYSYPSQAGYDLAKLPHVHTAILEEQARTIKGDLVNKSIRTLEAVMDDPAAPASAKVAAARAGLEAGGIFAMANAEAKMLGELAANGDGKPLEKMTEAELVEVMRKARQEADDGRTTLDGELVMPVNDSDPD